jgi:UDP-N-acetylglucosamine:LPS N-acetylglucosamine transferase
MEAPAGKGQRAMRKVLVATSAGGHWVQMRRLLPALAGCELVFAGVADWLDADLGPAPYYRLRNVSRSDPLGFFVVAWQLARVVRNLRPEVVVSTGAAPGLMAVVIGKLLGGCRTVWIDSVANSERLSLSGRLARPFADAWLVQWPHLARPGGPEHWGSVL